MAITAVATFLLTSTRPRARSMAEAEATAQAPQLAVSGDRNLGRRPFLVAPSVTTEDPAPPDQTATPKSAESPPPPRTASETREAYLKSVEASGHASGPWLDNVKGLLGEWEKGISPLPPGSRVLPVKCYHAACVASSIALNAADARQIEDAANDKFRHWTGARVAFAPAVDAAGSTTFTWLFYNPSGPGLDPTLRRE